MTVLSVFLEEEMTKIKNFTEGDIFGPLIRFSFPVMLALLLQTMYGAVDLWVVGKFASVADVSGVTTGSQLMSTLTNLISGLSMGLTVILGQKIGQKKEDEAGEVVGSGICLFTVIALISTALMLIFSRQIVTVMNAPQESFEQTHSYLFISSCGMLLIVAYNLIGSVFRGIGDSSTPLIAVAIACVFNIAGDLLLVKGFGMGAAGAAIATVAAQGFSVIICMIILKQRKLPFEFSIKSLHFKRGYVKGTLGTGFPIALQSALVGISFLFVTAIVNKMGVIASAAIGVSEKLTGFIMLVPISMMQSLTAFVAQNYGAQKMHRARKAMYYGMAVSFAYGALAFYFTFFHGDLLAGLFNKNAEVVASSFEYLRAISIDTVLVPFLFCFIGYFGGCGRTSFSLIQATIGAFGIRIPLAYIISRSAKASLFTVGLATPASTVIQIALCIMFFIILNKKFNARALKP